MKSKIAILTLALVPAFAGAQPGQGFPLTQTVDGFLGYLLYLGSKIMPLLILAALVWFLLGIFRIFFFKSDEADSKKKREFVLWGVVALFVMVSVWGLVNVLDKTLRLDNKSVPPAPIIPYPQSYQAQPNQ